MDSLEAQLREAVKKGDIDAIKRLIDAGAEIPAEDGGWEALLFAAGRGDEAGASRLIQAGVDVNAANERGGRALTYAAANGHAGIVRRLLAAGADVHARDKEGWNALMLAALVGHEDIVRCLLDAGASVNVRDKKGETALMCAAQGDHAGIIRLLLSKGARLEDHEFWAYRTALDFAAEDGGLDAVRALVEAGARAGRDGGSWALMWAALSDDAEMARLLIAAGADIHGFNDVERTSLAYAASWGSLDVVKVLLDAGVDVNNVDWKGNTALMLASDDEKGEEIKRLLKSAGALEFSAAQRFELNKHEQSIWQGLWCLHSTLARGEGGWCLRYELYGDYELAVPAPAVVPQRRDGLWEHTCFEAFAARPDEAGYWEFNFSPSGDWAAYAFAGERVRCAVQPPVQAPRIQCQRVAPDALQLEVWLPDWVDAPQGAWQWGLSAVIEDDAGGLSYWALHHPKAQPDFHDRAGWRALFEV